ncbi:MAG: SpoIVB peptidase [Haloplasmataceae bacterium]|jgi:stage IV sporulation protein B|nr:SpoIVB peptidase [Haloplasmataceae bacterium]
MDISVKKQFITVLFTIILSLFYNIEASGNTYLKAEDIYLTPGGETIGIELNTNVMIVDTYTVKGVNGTVDPAKLAGLNPGDIIVSINGKKAEQIEDVTNELMIYKDTQDKPLNIIIRREGRLYNKEIYPVYTKNNTISIGLYLRDNILGIGTLTFIYDNQYFGALGHQINDKNLLNSEFNKVTGIIKKAEVTSINKSVRGNPGEKRATFGKESIGNINENKNTGIYGKISSKEFNSKTKLGIATQNEIKLGDATILTVIENNRIDEFSIKIIELDRQNTKDIKGIKIKITDERLLDRTGGIVQGMSGSPIIQNNKIIGALTHVLVDDTTQGYGVYIEFMLEDMGIFIKH